MNRVAITGMGIICGTGHDLKSVWENITAGKSGISTLEQNNGDGVEGMPATFGGEVKNFTLSEDILDAREAPRFDRFIHFALHAADEAIGDAGLKGSTHYPAERMGAILGVGMGGFPEIQRASKALYDKGPRRISPFFIPAVIPNMTSGLISIKYGMKGLNFTIASACASAAHALSAAASEIMLGRQDVVVSGGAESVMNALSLAGFNSMKALSKNSEVPSKASRPFDTARDGFVMGEGAGVLVLENYEKAKARGAKIYAEIVGFGATSDAYHITAPHPEGDETFRCMQMAMEQAGVNPSEVGYVNAHGTSTPLGDIGETKAIKRAFGEHAKNLLVSSTKSMTGHLLGAAGGIESVFCAMALHTGVIPPTINLENQDPECDLNYVPNKAVNKEVKYALNNSFGFGGTNSSLLFKKSE